MMKIVSSPIRPVGGPSSLENVASAGGADVAVGRSAQGGRGIRVVVRVRPLQKHESADGAEIAIRAGNDGCTLNAVMAKSGDKEIIRQFTFDAVAAVGASQTDVFRLAGIPTLLDDALSGINVSIFAYGQTGSGKTYSMSGHEERMLAHGFRCTDESAGLIPRAMDYLFQRCADDRAKGEVTTTIRASMCEIFNENCFDLLNLTGQSLPLRYHPTNGFFVQGQVVVLCEKADDAMEVLSEGFKNRSVGSHALNMDSSRSHSILTLTIERSGPDPETGDVVNTRSKVLFVDLAGSERLKDSRSEGSTQLESRHINKSLFTLGKVIAALSDKRPAPPVSAQDDSSSNGGRSSSAAPGTGASGTRTHPRTAGGSSAADRDDAGPADAHIPYRDSKLTKLLADSLGGSAKTVMLSCITPAAAYLEETLNTLQYSLRASRIENAPVVQMDSRDAQMLALKKEIIRLHKENQLLRAHIGLPPSVPIDQSVLQELGPYTGSLADGGSNQSNGIGNGIGAGGAVGHGRPPAQYSDGSSASSPLHSSHSIKVGQVSPIHPLRLPKTSNADDINRDTSADGSGANGAVGSYASYGQLSGRRSRSRASSGRVRAAAAPGSAASGAAPDNRSAAGSVAVPSEARSLGSHGRSSSMDSMGSRGELSSANPSTGQRKRGGMLVDAAGGSGMDDGSLATRGAGFKSRTEERVAERSGTKAVIDLQQHELEHLATERDGLIAKHAAAKARIGALLSTVEDNKGTIDRLQRELESSKRSQREAERSVAAVISKYGRTAVEGTSPRAAQVHSASHAPSLSSSMDQDHHHPDRDQRRLHDRHGSSASSLSFAPDSARAHEQAELYSLRAEVSHLRETNALMDMRLSAMQRREMDLIEMNTSSTRPIDYGHGGSHFSDNDAPHAVGAAGDGRSRRSITHDRNTSDSIPAQSFAAEVSAKLQAEQLFEPSAGRASHQHQHQAIETASDRVVTDAIRSASSQGGMVTTSSAPSSRAGSMSTRRPSSKL